MKAKKSSIFRQQDVAECSFIQDVCISGKKIDDFLSFIKLCYLFIPKNSQQRSAKQIDSVENHSFGSPHRGGFIGILCPMFPNVYVSTSVMFRFLYSLCIIESFNTLVAVG
jgi:hypothetical protein